MMYSKVKRSSVLVRESIEDKNNFVMYAKGDAEQIVSLCSYRMNATGEMSELLDSDRDAIFKAMTAMTCTGLRSLGVCYRTYSVAQIPFKSMELQIRGQRRRGSVRGHGLGLLCWDRRPCAQRSARRNGHVSEGGHSRPMVTGDHLDTAKHIAKQCGILTCADHICMTGGEFRNLSAEDKKKLLLRSKPYRLLSIHYDSVTVIAVNSNVGVIVSAAKGHDCAAFHCAQTVCETAVIERKGEQRECESFLD